jgi:ankyrin repeat protein
MPATRLCMSPPLLIIGAPQSCLAHKALQSAPATDGGAEPLHYAADGGPGSGYRDSDGQQDTISYLIEAGADPNAIDKSGVTPLHRAVRNRSSGAVSTLIDKGADPLRMNKSGSTPLHLAVQNTGKSTAGSHEAKAEQHIIIVLLLEHGAMATDLGAKGKSVVDAASSEWIRRCSPVTDWLLIT